MRDTKRYSDDCVMCDCNCCGCTYNSDEEYEVLICDDCKYESDALYEIDGREYCWDCATDYLKAHEITI